MRIARDASQISMGRWSQCCGREVCAEVPVLLDRESTAAFAGEEGGLGLFDVRNGHGSERDKGTGSLVG